MRVALGYMLKYISSIVASRSFQVWVLGESFMSMQGTVHQPSSQTLVKGQPGKQAFPRVTVSRPALVPLRQRWVHFIFHYFRQCGVDLFVHILAHLCEHINLPVKLCVCVHVCAHTHIPNFDNCCQIELQKDYRFTFLLTVFARDSTPSITQVIFVIVS